MATTSMARLYRSRDQFPTFRYQRYILVGFHTDEPLSKEFNLSSSLNNAGFTEDVVPNVVEHEEPGSYGLVIADSSLDLLKEKFKSFSIVTDHNPLEPTEKAKHMYGTPEAERRALVATLKNAAEAVRDGCMHASKSWYCKALLNAGLGTELERAILNWDIQHAPPNVRERFTQNLMFVCLNGCDRSHTPSISDIEQRGQEAWLQRFQNDDTSPYERLRVAGYAQDIEKLEMQTLLLFRRILEYSGGAIDDQRSVLRTGFTTSQNMSLCANFLDVTHSNEHGRFDPDDIRAAISKSKLYAKVPLMELPDPVAWASRLFLFVPVGIPDRCVNLPPQFLQGFDAQVIGQISIQLEETYCRFPSLKRKENDILVLLAWSSMYHGQTLEVLKDWINSEESENLYQRLIKDLKLQQTPEDFALSLAALLCRERLLPYTTASTAEGTEDSRLMGFDAILKCREIRNRRPTVEHIVSSLVRVLRVLTDFPELIEFLEKAVNPTPSMLGPLDGFVDQYCEGKVRGQDHDESIGKISKTFQACRDAMREMNRHTDNDWVELSRRSAGIDLESSSSS